MSPNSPDDLAMALERRVSRLLRRKAFCDTDIAFAMDDERVTFADLRLILSRLASQEETIRADGEALKQADVALANVTAFEDDARYIMGNTNFEITKHCRDEIRARLSARQGGGAG